MTVTDDRPESAKRTAKQARRANDTHNDPEGEKGEELKITHHLLQYHRGCYTRNMGKIVLRRAWFG